MFYFWQILKWVFSESSQHITMINMQTLSAITCMQMTLNFSHSQSYLNAQNSDKRTVWRKVWCTPQFLVFKDRFKKRLFEGESKSAIKQSNTVTQYWIPWEFVIHALLVSLWALQSYLCVFALLCECVWCAFTAVAEPL